MRAAAGGIRLVLMLLLLPIGTGEAQAGPLTAPALPVLEKIRVGQTVRAESTGGQEFRGRLLGADAAGLRIATAVDAGAEAALPLTDLRALWVRGRATKTGALIGAGTGFVVGALFGLLVEAIADEGDDDGFGASAGAALAVGGIFAIGGGGVGAAIGAALPKWHRKYP